MQSAWTSNWATGAARRPYGRRHALERRRALYHFGASKEKSKYFQDTEILRARRTP